MLKVPPLQVETCLVSTGNVRVLMLQLKILTNEYIVLPAAGDFLLHAGSAGYTETHGFTATIGVTFAVNAPVHVQLN